MKSVWPIYFAFAAALLTMPLALANLLQAVPSGMSSSPPTPPAQAQAAGFMTCIVCMDFTAASGGVWVNGAAVSGANAAQTNTWLDCAGASNPIFFQGLNQNPLIRYGPCPTITTDSVLGQQALLQNVPASNSPPGGENGIVIFNPVGPAGIMAPTNNYIEMTFIVPQFPQRGFMQGQWFGGAGQIPNNLHNYFEFDAFEVQDNTNSGAYTSATRNWNPNWGCGPCFGPTAWSGTFPPNYDSFNFTSEYLRVGMRTTSDGTSQIFKCVWIGLVGQPDVKQTCQGWTASGTMNTGYAATQLSDANSRWAAYFTTAGVDYNANVNPPGTTSPMNGYIKSLNLWSCASWATTACSTPGNADPGGY